MFLWVCGDFVLALLGGFWLLGEWFVFDLTAVSCFTLVGYVGGWAFACVSFWFVF